MCHTSRTGLKWYILPFLLLLPAAVFFCPSPAVANQSPAPHYTHTHPCTSIFERTFMSIMNYPSPYPNPTWPPDTNPDLRTVEDQPKWPPYLKYPHFACGMSTHTHTFKVCVNIQSVTGGEWGPFNTTEGFLWGPRRWLGAADNFFSFYFNCSFHFFFFFSVFESDA